MHLRGSSLCSLFFSDGLNKFSVEHLNSRTTFADSTVVVYTFGFLLRTFPNSLCRVSILTDNFSQIAHGLDVCFLLTMFAPCEFDRSFQSTSAERRRVTKETLEWWQAFFLSLSPFSSRLASLHRSFRVAGTPACKADCTRVAFIRTYGKEIFQL